MTAPYKEVPLASKTQKETRDTKKKSGGRPKANSAEPKSPIETPSNQGSSTVATVWKLPALDQESITKMCCPLNSSATMMDGN